MFNQMRGMQFAMTGVFIGQYRGLPTHIAKVLVLGWGTLCFIAQVRAADNASPPGILYAATLINSDTTSSAPQVSAITLDAAGKDLLQNTRRQI